MEIRRRTIGTTARGVIDAGKSGTQRAGQAAGDRAAEAVERVLAGIFDGVYDVPDAETARYLIADAPVSRSPAVWSIVEGFALLRLTRWISRFGRFSVARLAIAVAPAALSSMRQTVERGLVQLRVLASFLAGRAHAEGIELDKALLRAATVEAYLEPRREVSFRYTGGRAGRAVASYWARAAASRSDERTQRLLADERIAAIARLDLRDLDQRWRERPVAAG